MVGRPPRPDLPANIGGAPCEGGGGPSYRRVRAEHVHDPAPDRTTLELNLTPGVLVASEMVALIDSDGDGEISETEGDAYANEVLRDVSLEVDGEPQPLTLTSSQFPTPLDIRAGMGTIRLQV